MSPQHPLVWCPPPLRPKATTICRLPQRSTVPTTTAVYRPISVNGMFKTVPSQEESFHKSRRSIYTYVQNERSYITRLSSRINIPTSTEEKCAKALNTLFLYILRALFPNGCNRFLSVFWCIDVPSMVAISLTGLFSAHITIKLHYHNEYCDPIMAN